MKIGIITFLFLLLTCCSSQYELSERERNSIKIKKEFALTMRKKKLYAEGVGGAELNGKTTEIAMTFRSKELLDLETLRELIVEATCTLLNIINSNEENRPFFETFPVTENIADIGIINSYPKNRSENDLFAVSLFNGIVYYKKDKDITNEYSPLITVHKESFEEAKAIVCQSKACNCK